MKPNDELISYILDDSMNDIPEFKSQEELETFFGEPVPFSLKDYNTDPEYFWSYLRDWQDNHKFEVIKKDERVCDRYTGTAEVTVIYTLDDKYYSITYTSYIYFNNEFDHPSREVVPVEETIIKYIEV